jgi:hypothetical protein
MSWCYTIKMVKYSNGIHMSWRINYYVFAYTLISYLINSLNPIKIYTLNKLLKSPIKQFPYIMNKKQR